MPAATITSTNGAATGASSRRSPATQTDSRVSAPSYYSPFAGNGLGVVPRRGIDALTSRLLLGTPAGLGACSPTFGGETPLPGAFAFSSPLAQFATLYPLRLLSVLPLAHPMAGLVDEINKSLAFSPGDTQIVAVKDTGKDAGRDAVDDAGTAALGDFWDRQSGGLCGFQRALAGNDLWNGLTVVEAVPSSDRSEVIGEIILVDSLTCRFHHENDDPKAPTYLEQFQSGNGWVRLPSETVFTVAVDGTVDEPYGRPRLASSLNEALEDVGTRQRLRDIMKVVAWPHFSIGFDLEGTVQFYTDNARAYGLVNLPGDAVDMALKDFEVLNAKVLAMRADDFFIRPKGSEVQQYSGGAGTAALEPILRNETLRLAMAFKIPPSMTGHTDGGTKAYSQEQYKQYVQMLLSIRALVNSIIVKVSNLFLRLASMPLTARADVKPIASIDVYMEQQARQLEIANILSLVSRGYMTEEEGSITLTGSGVADKSRLPQPGQATADTPDPDDNPGDNQQQQQQTGPSERQPPP